MNRIRSISSVLLAVLVLMASSSFYVGVHICGGTVKAIAFLQEADGCGHQELPPCHRKAMDGCCENDQVIHEGLDFKTTDAFAHAPLTAATILHTSLVLAEIVPTTSITPIPFRSDHPPALTGYDIIISNQTFLI
jgi:hypothetical protein